MDTWETHLFRDLAGETPKTPGDVPHPHFGGIMGAGLWWRGSWLSLLVAATVCGCPPRAAADETATDEPAATAAETAAEPEADTEPTPAATDASAAADGVADAAGSVAPVDEPASEPLSARRIRLKIDVSGELFAPAGREAPPIRQPITVAARFDFVETPTAEAGAVVRRYSDAAAELQVAGAARRTTLAADAREVLVSLQGTTPSPCLPRGFLSRDECDLLDTPFDPLLLDSLQPAAAVASGERWTIGADATAGLLAIDTVESGELESRVVEVADGRATVKLAGVIDGAVDGVPTHLVVEGSWSLPVDDDATSAVVRLDGPIAGIDVTIRERREASHVAPGFDVEARLVMARSAAPDAAGVDDAGADEAGKVSLRRRGTGRPGFVWHREAAGRYDLVHDARWRVIEDGADGLVMRLVDRGALAGQCSIAALPRADALAPPTIAEVERDVARSLEGQFGGVESSAEATRDDGVRIVRVVADGRADGLPFRWIHYVLSDAEGRRLAATFMVEEPLAKRFGTADRDLIDGVRMPAEGGGEEATGQAGRPPARQARLPSESSTP